MPLTLALALAMLLLLLAKLEWLPAFLLLSSMVPSAFLVTVCLDLAGAVTILFELFLRLTELAPAPK